MDKKAKVNLFVVGAPKCGTTALCSYLADHKDICLSQVKEPHFFAHEFRHFRNVIRNLDEYEDQFSHAKGTEKIYMEGSVYYLYGKKSIENVKKYNKDAKIIVMLRNPIDMAQSMHSQLIWTYDEDVIVFEEAWRLQNERLRGKKLPKLCREPLFLQYGSLCSLGDQVERLLYHFSKEQILFIDNADMNKNVRAVYRQVLDFIGVEDDEREVFGRVNENKRHKIKWLAKFTVRPPKALVKLLKAFKSAAKIKKLGVMDFIRKFSDDKTKRKPISPELETELREYFRSDVEKLSLLIGRNYSQAWGFD